jgi:hypothetical protein
MKKISYIISPSYRISAHIDNQPYVVNPDHPRYKDIVAAIQQDDADTFKKLADINSAIADYTIGLVSVVHGVVKFKDRVVQTYTAQRILDAMKLGLPFEPVIRFLENVMLNPSKRAVDELDHWMSHNDIPITDDGFWLGYKRLHFTGTQAWVTPNLQHEMSADLLNIYNHDEERLKNEGHHKVDIYVDCHSKTIRQWVGKVVEVERNTVDDNFGIDCSEGLHVGSQSYVKSYSSEESLTTVKVNPADVVSVPRERSEQVPRVPLLHHRDQQGVLREAHRQRHRRRGGPEPQDGEGLHPWRGQRRDPVTDRRTQHLHQQQGGPRRRH